jgi:hypothetical protein
MHKYIKKMKRKGKHCGNTVEPYIYICVCEMKKNDERLPDNAYTIYS